jgi:methylenetetrahydrofolate dehydrogenase (NADP+)/methenyltetrahydrofolate cyclohydrolase
MTDIDNTKTGRAQGARILYGKPVSESIDADSIKRCKILRREGLIPTLATLRVGDKADDRAYEKSIQNKCSSIGIEVKSFVLDDHVSENEYFSSLNKLSHIKSIHGILLFCPLPEHISERRARNQMMPSKDVDGFAYASLTGLFAEYNVGFAPCTAQAAIEILDYYNIPIEGKHAVVLGRSLVIGKPVSMMLTSRNATVTLCHSKTRNIEALAREADILISSLGILHKLDTSFFSPGQTVIDVGINWDDKNKRISGDVCFDEAKEIVSALTPVPGGLGGVTTSVLMHHLIEAAEDFKKVNDESHKRIFRKDINEHFI